jgi:hypothetical protein
MRDELRIALTVGRIAQKLGAPLHRIEYVLRTRRNIRPVASTGNARIFAEEDLGLIEAALREMDFKRDSRVGRSGEQPLVTLRGNQGGSDATSLQA